MLFGYQPGYTSLQSIEQGIAYRPLVVNLGGGALCAGALDDTSGNPLQSNGSISLKPTTTTSAPSAGGAGALPATPTGYMTIRVNGTNRQVPYY